MVKDLFRDAQQTEFVIATIPTVLGVNESARLAASLKRDSIPCRRIIVNQVVTESMGDKYIAMKLKDQERSLAAIEADPELKDLTKLRGPLLDLEVRGPAALQYFGDMLWAPAFDGMAASPDRRYVMLGGKGGVGKTSSAASLAVKFAAAGHSTLVVSTDPAHSLSDALDQDVSGGAPVAVEGIDLPLWGMEVDVERARADIRAVAAADDDRGNTKAQQFLSSVGLGAFADQLQDLKLSELLDTLPPGVDEVVAISKVVSFLRAPEYARFSRIVFDTAPTGHTLRLLTLPDFLDATIGKVVRLRAKLTDAAGAVKGMFGIKSEKDPAVAKLEALQERMEEARALFRNRDTTEFVIVTIPTAMAVAESGRLAKALRAEGVPVNAIAVNQVLEASASQQFLASKRTDQQRALAKLREDPALRELEVTEAPLVDLEVRGVPALQFFGDTVWK
jgi:arsenite-transporting ATPase